ncbi:Ctr copper transporter [Phellopilus nigrolimitatus]|nr:Ctr copper transporter [Phellopilus nigrolimitatus]
MIPYLHFAGGDALFFKQITPSSKGALAGAAIFLFFLAMLERFIVAMRAVMEARWRQRAKTFLVGPDVPLKDNSGQCHDDKDSRISVISATKTRTIPPFIASHDFPRGAIHAVQSLVYFALMLAVMTFQAAYVIMIILGLGIGELVFGRVAVRSLSGH